jgi:uncharacterized protein YqeY
MKQKLKESLKIAMKAQDKLRMETIRALISEIQYEEMRAEKDELPTSECNIVLQREVKKRSEAIGFAESAKRLEERDKLQSEIKIIEEFLLKQLSAEELDKLLTDFKGSSQGAVLGTAMKFLKDQFAGQYDGKLASEIARRIFAS